MQFEQTINFETMTGYSPEDSVGEQARYYFTLPDHPWKFWRQFVIRGSGFPASQIQLLADTAYAESVDTLLKQEREIEQLWATATAEMGHELDLMKQTNGGETEKEKRLLLLKIIRQLRKGKMPSALEALYGEDRTQEMIQARTRLTTLSREVESHYRRTTASLYEKIRHISQDARFREAITWQNRNALQNSIFHPSLTTKMSGSDQREGEMLVANYLQRYCLKNDTIGFFGPVGWAQIQPERDMFEVNTEKDLIISREVFFEIWAIDAIASILAKKKRFQTAFIPRRNPLIRIDGTTLYQTNGHQLTLSPRLITVLECCNGRRTAQEVAKKLLQMPVLRLKSPVEVYNLLGLLRERSLIIWTLEVPFATRPDQLLRAQLNCIEEKSLREEALAPLNELEVARQEVARAAGNTEKLDEALAQLERTFMRLTQLAPTRNAGKTYAGRTLIFEDCRRDLTVTIGPQLLNTLGTPLSLLLTSARWCTYKIAEWYRQEFSTLYKKMIEETGEIEINLAVYWRRAQQILFAEERPWLAPLQQSLQKKWQEILQLTNQQLNQQSVTYHSEHLRQRVNELFDSPHAGWYAARYHSPDIMIVATDEAAIARNEYQLVLGEMHLGRNTLDCALFVLQHPHPEELYQTAEKDIPEARFFPIIPRYWPTTTFRTRPVLINKKDKRLAFALDSCSDRAEDVQEIALSDMILHEVDKNLRVHTRNRDWEGDILEVFAETLSVSIIDSFKFLPTLPHRPRITIDQLVISRETWHVPVSSLSFAFEKDAQQRFIMARRWMQEQRLPRHIFVKAPTEIKPGFIDFASPIYVDILAKLARNVARQHTPESFLTITEMLPGIEQVWLPDAQGRRYTSELRMVIVDNCAFPPNS